MMLDTVVAALANVTVVDEIEVPAAASSLDFLRAVYADPNQPISRRIRCAVAALPFEHPKLAVTAVVSGEGFAAKLEEARARAAKAICFQKVEVLKEID
ncbi:hypothetical protein HU675_0011455 [Bradyrhizobium septentrionale]|uniref:hypothetical protein n=1 Tax=Bradyrhizobium septentrionale TaxID=1404411 RepID=UPI001CD5367C|nr:hypothetical protein [Bradyrhizobium septentrionale]UGY27316.1 hypothetical protein HU675_0011455 [Bradyrhizobium septentrionale]